MITVDFGKEKNNQDPENLSEGKREVNENNLLQKKSIGVKRGKATASANQRGGETQGGKNIFGGGWGKKWDHLRGGDLKTTTSYNF